MLAAWRDIIKEREREERVTCLVEALARTLPDTPTSESSPADLADSAPAGRSLLQAVVHTHQRGALLRHGLREWAGPRGRRGR